MNNCLSQPLPGVSRFRNGVSPFQYGQYCQNGTATLRLGIASPPTRFSFLYEVTLG